MLLTTVGARAGERSAGAACSYTDCCSSTSGGKSLYCCDDCDVGTFVDTNEWCADPVHSSLFFTERLAARSQPRVPHGESVARGRTFLEQQLYIDQHSVLLPVLLGRRVQRDRKV